MELLEDDTIKGSQTLQFATSNAELPLNLTPSQEERSNAERRRTGSKIDGEIIAANAEMEAISAMERSRKRALQRKILAFVFSHLGLVVLLIVYAIIGGILFRSFESKYEIQQRQGVADHRAVSVDKLWDMTTKLSTPYEPNWTALAQDIMLEFQESLVTAMKIGGWDGRDEGEGGVKWSFAGSILYSMTVLTTIGYGHIAPKTTMGRIATMLYALPGIPLTLLCLSTIGTTWAKCFRFFYRYISQQISFSSTTDMTSHISGGSHDTNIKAKKQKQAVRVPLFVSLFIIAAYIAAGSLMFSIWEEDWDYLIAAYFCFITLSTIGFGDYVFGVGKELNSNTKLFTGAIYMLMGLSIIAMCFNLMQEEVKEKFLSIGKYFGFIDKKKKVKL